MLSPVVDVVCLKLRMKNEAFKFCLCLRKIGHEKAWPLRNFFETVGNSSKNSYVIHSIEKLNFKDNYIYKNIVQW